MLKKSTEKSTDSLQTTKTTKFFEDGTTAIITQKKTIFANNQNNNQIDNQTDNQANISKKPKIEESKAIKLSNNHKWQMIFLIFVQIFFVTMVYGPIAAFLVEIFPTNIRYTSMSLPYHVGNGIFGGLTPYIVTRIIETTKTDQDPTGDILAGLWYPIGVAALCFVIGLIYLPKNTAKNL